MNFIFDRDFDAETAYEHPGANQNAQQSFSYEDLRTAERTARAEGFEAGRVRGRAEATEEAQLARAEERNDALLAVAEQMDALCKEAAEHRETLETQMTEFALVACERLMPEILQMHSTERASAEVQRCLGQVMGSSRIRVYLSQHALEKHRDAIERSIQNRHSKTDVELIANSSLEDGDARVEWDNGVMEYSFGKIAESLLEALRRTQPLPAETTEEGRKSHG